MNDESPPFCLYCGIILKNTYREICNDCFEKMIVQSSHDQHKNVEEPYIFFVEK
jgi:hypothetical protein